MLVGDGSSGSRALLHADTSANQDAVFRKRVQALRGPVPNEMGSPAEQQGGLVALGAGRGSGGSLSALVHAELERGFVPASSVERSDFVEDGDILDALITVGTATPHHPSDTEQLGD